MRLEDMREQFPKMPESMKRMIEQEVAVQIGQEKENDNPKVVTYKKRKKKNMAHRMLVASMVAALALATTVCAGVAYQMHNQKIGNTALLIEGARRIGKSTVVESFAKNEYQSYILIDFSTVSKSIKALFEDISDLDYLFLQLQLQYKVDLHERNSLIIFDEVQLCPLARQAIKSLVKDHRYDYIETGSLISIKKNIQNILIPSEERKLSMYPMDYEEFLWALGDHTTTALVRKLFDSRHPIGDKLHRKLMRDFRLYMLVGGMPQAVNEYLQTNNFRKVDTIKRDILNLYEDDFKKIDSTGKLSLLFDAIHAMININCQG